MAWHYEKPKAKKLIIGPKTSWLYVPEDHAVYVQNAESLLKSRLTMRFFTGLGKLREDFQVEYAKPNAVDKDGNPLLVLTPRDPGLGVSRLYLTIGKEDLQVHEVRFTDSYGNLTRVAFRDLKENVAIPDRTFSFRPQRESRFFTSLIRRSSSPFLSSSRNPQGAAMTTPSLENITSLSRDALLGLEWLETNGQGGFAASTLLNCHTRKYHGLLAANLKSPAGRYVLLSKLEDAYHCSDRATPLFCHRFPDCFAPAETPPLRSFRWDPGPVFEYGDGGFTLRKEVLLVFEEDQILIRLASLLTALRTGT